MKTKKIKRGSIESMVIGLFCAFGSAGLLMFAVFGTPADIDRINAAIRSLF